MYMNPKNSSGADGAEEPAAPRVWPYAVLAAALLAVIVILVKR